MISPLQDSSKFSLLGIGFSFGFRSKSEFGRSSLLVVLFNNSDLGEEVDLGEESDLDLSKDASKVMTLLMVSWRDAGVNALTILFNG